MDGQKLIDQIKRSLAEAKKSGQTSVAVEALEQYLDAIGPAIEKSQAHFGEYRLATMSSRRLRDYSELSPSFGLRIGSG